MQSGSLWAGSRHSAFGKVAWKAAVPYLTPPHMSSRSMAASGLNSAGTSAAEQVGPGRRALTLVGPRDGGGPVATTEGTPQVNAFARATTTAATLDLRPMPPTTPWPPGAQNRAQRSVFHLYRPIDHFRVRTAAGNWQCPRRNGIALNPVPHSFQGCSARGRQLT